MKEINRNHVVSIEGADGQPAATYSALAKIAESTVGAKLFNLVTFELTNRGGRGINSNLPEAYPESGRNELPYGPWTDQIIGKRQTFVAKGFAAIAEVISSREAIRSFGCEATISTFISIAGKAVRTINFHVEACARSTERVATARSLTLPGISRFLMSAKFFEDGG